MLRNVRSFATGGFVGALCVICAIGGMDSGVQAQAQALYNVLTYQEIPRICDQFCTEKRPYETWSLFLVCNPRWILESGDKGILDLFKAYRAFGRAIGEHNLAVWFSHSPGPIPTVENTDIERMSKYCVNFGLLPSQTPQVVTVTHYPDDENAGGKVVANLNGDAADSARTLTDLTDELSKTGLNQSSLDENHWGSRVAASVSTAMSHAACYLNKVSFSIKTGVFNAEIAHAVDKGC